MSPQSNSFAAELLRLRGGGPVAAPVDVAERGVEGSGLGLPYADTLQWLFGSYEVSGISAHMDPSARQASADIGADAYAMGERVAFSGAPDLHQVAHEATHVLQQRAGVAVDGDSGQAGDVYEQQAEDVARKVARGESVEELLDRTIGPAGQRGGVRRRAVQRQESPEHKYIGDNATRSAQGQPGTVQLAEDYIITFGDAAALPDYFDSTEQIQRLASLKGPGPGTREEIEYVIDVKVHGHKDHENLYSEGARYQANKRYYRLAGANDAHFTDPGGGAVGGGSTYHDCHNQALQKAAELGAAKKPIDEAMLLEAFADHFLMDGFSAGHIRTQRHDISAYWNAKVPMFWPNLKMWIAQEMARYINDHAWGGYVLTVDELWSIAQKEVESALQAKGVTSFTFGDLVAGALHDYDSKHGVDTQYGKLYGDGQILDKSGQPIASGQKTAGLATEATKLSVAEVTDAYAKGAGASPAEVSAGYQKDGKFAAERQWPQALPEEEQETRALEWQVDSSDTLLSDAGVKEAVGIMIGNKTEELSDIRFEDSVTGGATAKVKRDGFESQVLAPLKGQPVPTLKQVIAYTPQTGGGVGGGNTDDNAVAYTELAEQTSAGDGKSGLDTLLVTQRASLIRDIIGGGMVSPEEESKVLDLLSHASPEEMCSVIEHLGQGSVKVGVSWIEAHMCMWSWRSLLPVLRRSEIVAAEL